MTMIFGPHLFFSTVVVAFSTFNLNFLFYGGLYAFPQVTEKLFCGIVKENKYAMIYFTWFFFYSPTMRLLVFFVVFLLFFAFFPKILGTKSIWRIPAIWEPHQECCGAPRISSRMQLLFFVMYFTLLENVEICIDANNVTTLCYYLSTKTRVFLCAILSIFTDTFWYFCD